MECILCLCILMEINDDDLEFNGFLEVLLKFNRKWYGIIWNQFTLFKWIINISVIKLFGIYYVEENDSETGLPKTLALLKCNVKVFFSLNPLWTILETE